ncbi:hypothetical protein Ciccas_004727 [Cichlidogyrus casuarinus]|uniref:Uncharacterized protein n=1 Tax=Cichlidogyrus casuarinus TaxID=1844966 RepID=A0ABD2QAQ9_9PLAT
MGSNYLNKWLKHVNVHNRIIEEEHCYRQHTEDKRDVARRKRKHKYDEDKEFRKQQKMRKLNAELKELHYKVDEKNNSLIQAPAEGGVKAANFWYEVARKNHASSSSSTQKWKHDAFEKQALLFPNKNTMLISDNASSDVSSLARKSVKKNKRKHKKQKKDKKKKKSRRQS